MSQKENDFIILSRFLEVLNLKEYWEALVDYGVEKLSDFRDLDDEEWEELNIKDIHRDKIINYLEKVSMNPNFPGSSSNLDNNPLEDSSTEDIVEPNLSDTSTSEPSTPNVNKLNSPFESPRFPPLPSLPNIPDSNNSVISLLVDPGRTRKQENLGELLSERDEFGLPILRRSRDLSTLRKNSKRPPLPHRKKVDIKKLPPIGTPFTKGPLWKRTPNKTVTTKQKELQSNKPQNIGSQKNETINKSFGSNLGTKSETKSSADLLRSKSSPTLVQEHKVPNLPTPLKLGKIAHTKKPSVSPKTHRPRNHDSPSKSKGNENPSTPRGNRRPVTAAIKSKLPNFGRSATERESKNVSATRTKFEPFVAKVIEDFVPTSAGQLHLKKGDIVNITSSLKIEGWGRGENQKDGTIGIFPLNAVTKIRSIKKSEKNDKLDEINEESELNQTKQTKQDKMNLMLKDSRSQPESLKDSRSQPESLRDSRSQPESLRDSRSQPESTSNTDSEQKTVITESTHKESDETVEKDHNKNVDTAERKLIWAKATYDNEGEEELTFQTGDIIKVLLIDPTGWWLGEANGQTGYFPGNRCEIVRKT